jgi:hypothetical protein
MEACTSFNPLPRPPLKGEGAGGNSNTVRGDRFCSLNVVLSLEREDYMYGMLRNHLTAAYSVA